MEYSIVETPLKSSVLTSVHSMYSKNKYVRGSSQWWSYYRCSSKYNFTLDFYGHLLYKTRMSESFIFLQFWSDFDGVFARGTN